MLKKIILFLLIGVNIFCSDSITKVVNPQELLNFYKGKEGIAKWESVRNNEGNLQQSEKEVTIKITDKDVRYTEKSDIENKEMIYDLQFNLLRKEMKVFGRDAEFDRLVYETDKNKIYMTKYKNGKSVEKKEKENKNIFDSDPIILEYLFAKGCKIFNGDMLTPEGKYNMEYKLTDTNDLENIGKSYMFPPGFKKNIVMKKEYKVYIGGMTGVVANFYPYKWYYIIDKDTGNILAYFGGNPKDEAEFEYRVKG